MGLNALIPYAGKNLAKQSSKKAGQEIAQELAQRATTGLSGMLGGKLGKFSGSTLDGILGKSSGLKLPNAPVKPIEQYLGSSIADSFADEAGFLDDDFVKAYFKPAVRDKLRAEVADYADMMRPRAYGEAGEITATHLPKIRTSDYVSATGYRGEDIPKYMRPYLSEKNGIPLGDNRWGEVFSGTQERGGGSMSLMPNDILERYDMLLDNDYDARNVYTKENYAGVFNAFPELAKEYEEPIRRAFDTQGGANLIHVDREGPGKQKIKVSRGGVQDLIPETKAPEVPMGKRVDNIVDEAIGSMNEDDAKTFDEAKGMFEGIKQNYGTQPTAPVDIMGQEGEPIDVPLANKPKGSTRAQRGVRNKTEMWTNSFGSVPRATRQQLYKKYEGSGNYKSMADRLMGRNIDPANLQSVVEGELAGIEAIKQSAIDYADNAGVAIDLSKIPTQLSLSSMQKQRLAELGLELDSIFGDSAVAVPVGQANTLYMTLRDMGKKLSQASDPTYQLAGDACYDVAHKIGQALDETMDGIGFDYKTKLVQLMADSGDDPTVIRAIAGKSDFKFSDLRKEQAPFMVAKDMVGLKLPKGDTINVFGFNTGIPNPVPGMADKAREKFYDWQAGSGGDGGSRINFVADEGGAGGRGGALRDAGLIGGGALLGSLLGGGGGAQTQPQGNSMLDQMPSTEPQQMPEPTLGGYTYEQLKQAYTLAMLDGNMEAGKYFKDMMGVLGEQIEAQQEAQGGNKTSAGVNALKELYRIYQTAGGSQGILRGGATNALNAISGGAYNPDVANYEAIKEATSSLIIRALGEKGALSDRDRLTIAKSLPNMTDSPEVAERKFNSLYTMLMTAQE